MFPGFVTIYKDKENHVHLYFFPGIDENDKPFYRDLDLSKCSCTFTEQTTDDGGKDYVFDNPRIIKFVCKLIDNQGQSHVMELLVK